MQTAIFLILNVVVGALANVFLKIGSESWAGSGVGGFLKVAVNRYFILGILLFVVNFPLYSFVLHKMKLSVAFPLVTALTFLLVVVISAVYFKESLSAVQYIAIVVLALGLWLLVK